MTVTHPLHPLYGQPVEVVRVRRGVDPDLIVRLPDGRHAAIAQSWTATTLPSDGDAPSTMPPLLDVEGLAQLVVIIARIRAAGAPPLGAAGGAASPPVGAVLPPTRS